MADPWRVLSPDQAEVARAFLGEREADRRHLVIYLSGAHAYGFPSPDSDPDLKCIHITPTARLVGLTPGDDPPDRIEVVRGVELDYGSNELAAALRGAIKGNGNFLERFLGELALGGDLELLAEAREVVRPLLSRRVAHHYGGFARSQLKAFDDRPSAKRALYVLRTTATGRHVLAHGSMETDVANLGAFLPAELEELLAIKRSGERRELAPEHAGAWRGRLLAAIAAVDEAARASPLPGEPPQAALDGVDAWLRTVRRRYWD
ncbi:MAG: nucleotidyltransferase domain-containing protein [Deltaproteobacteria bacterium]|nr:nucleotidyltransferase domain-containing protein [Deltaproteobacteria bacterium]